MFLALGNFLECDRIASINAYGYAATPTWYMIRFYNGVIWHFLSKSPKLVLGISHLTILENNAFRFYCFIFYQIIIIYLSYIDVRI